ncbi:helix-turn-helix domain-containing protein [Vulgatibacter incomptus]|uniref:HTH cro/C1-type domain-containing protein n=1 Tax=Vulgatibacter incomptus TaxID=1391653 RepID=A0A0K1P985_9BACT|nr:helix-turn-helix transcriptional regulator [Vulgatibacter incomptus]AKU90098.1 hypothetical protein AKJ08_0485 [Vulgatibacter incomptus]
MALPFDLVVFRCELGRQILAVRREAGLTQAELANRAGVSNEFLSRIENGTGIPSLETIGRLAAALGLPACQLFPPAEDLGGAAASRLLRVVSKLDEGDRELVVRLAEQVAKAREGAAPAGRQSRSRSRSG